MSSDRTEWPNESRLEELREAGIVPYSRLSTHCVLILAVLWGVWIVGEDIDLLLNALVKNAQSAVTLQVPGEEVREALLRIIALPSLCAIAVSCIWGLFQTKFLFRWRRLGFDLGRLNRFSGIIPEKVMLQLAGALIVPLLALGAAGFFVRILIRDLFSLFSRTPAAVPEQIGQLLINLAAPVGAFLGLVALLALLAERLRFGNCHRMTRRELEESAGDGART